MESLNNNSNVAQQGITEQKNEFVHKILGGLQDSLELSTPAKGGAIKIYCDFKNIEETRLKIDNAIDARNYAQVKMGGTNCAKE